MELKTRSSLWLNLVCSLGLWSFWRKIIFPFTPFQLSERPFTDGASANSYYLI
jgi:hypothetical protein